jgi:acetyl-CoA carboxylase biotin carboxyl carrier protein
MHVVPVVPWSIARIKSAAAYPGCIFPAVVREAAGGARGGAMSSQAKSNWSERLPDVEAHITGTVWKIECQIGQSVEEGDTLVILESMKMEMPVEAEDDGTVKEIVCEEGQSVSEGDTLVVLE